MNKTVCVGAVSALIGIVGAVQAADDPLTLDSAVQMAIATAPQWQARQAAIESAEASAIGAGRLPDPALVTGVDNWPSNGPDAWSLGRDFMTMRKIGLMQSFPNSHRRQSERAVAKAQVSAARAEAADTQLQIRQSAARAWIAQYVAELALQNLQHLKPGLALQVELTRAAVASGRASVSDALSALAAAAELDDRMLDAQRELDSARALLARWVGDAADRPLGSPPAFGSLPASAAELLSSLHHHAALQAFDARIDAARSDLEAARATKRPDWSAELDYARRGRDYSDMVSVQFQVTLPLFTSTRQNPMIDAKRAEVRKLEADREAERRMHTADMQTMLAEWQSAKDRLALYEQQRLPLARQRTELALAGLRAGRMALRDSLAVINEQISIERSYAELMRSIGTAWAYLNYLPTQGNAK